MTRDWFFFQKIAVIWNSVFLSIANRLYRFELLLLFLLDEDQPTNWSSTKTIHTRQNAKYSFGCFLEHNGYKERYKEMTSVCFLLLRYHMTKRGKNIAYRAASTTKSRKSLRSGRRATCDIHILTYGMVVCMDISMRVRWQACRRYFLWRPSRTATCSFFFFFFAQRAGLLKL